MKKNINFKTPSRMQLEDAKIWELNELEASARWLVDAVRMERNRRKYGQYEKPQEEGIALR